MGITLATHHFTDILGLLEHILRSRIAASKISISYSKFEGRSLINVLLSLYMFSGVESQK